MRLSVSVVLGSLLLAPASGAQQPVMDPDAPTLQVMAFGDLVYLATERDLDQGFLLGQAVGHVSAQLSRRLAFFGELSATPRPTGFGVEAERLILRYDFADAFKLSAGRYHTPVGYWNTAYHHGLWLQTSVARPEMIRFGSRVVPVHFVGLLAEGMLPGPALGLRYGAGVGNGRSANIARAGDAGDANAVRAWVLSLSSRPAALHGLQIGASLYSDRAANEAGAEVDERILGGHLVWGGERPELLAEVVRLYHEPVATSARMATSDAYYVQMAYRLPGVGRAFKPYVRAERVRVAEDDVLLAPLGLGYDALLAGVRFDFAPLAALKLEFRREQLRSAAWFNSAYAQASFAVPGPGGVGGMHMRRSAPLPRVFAGEDLLP